MKYRKFSADKIFNGFEFFNHEHVLITDDSGRVEGLVPQSEAGDDIEKFSGILTPGFINA
ncbi:MAG: hypothetical protein RLZZ64_903, partial [Bacteroidota bacterium]